jgi:MFS family permease
VAASAQDTVVETDIPSRLDRLPWSRWHWMIVLALGITWVLDGIEVTIVGAVSAVLQRKDTLGLSSSQIGEIAAAYVAGAVIGALFFGYLTDKLGRKKLFIITLAWYTVFTVLTAFSWDFLSFAAFRVLTGIGIGGEYAAINSAIDELIPARRRGVTDLSINSSYWLGAMIASALSLVLLDPKLVPPQWGWRVAFFLGAVLAAAVIVVRRLVPESPRWLLTHGRHKEAEETVRAIEDHVRRSLGTDQLPVAEGEPISVDQSHTTHFGDIVRTLLREYPRRTFVAVTLMVTQAFLYNAVFFTLAITLTTFFHVAQGSVGLYILPFAAGNMVGPWVLGPLFDSIGRRAMIAGTYIISGLLLIVTGVLFLNGMLNATTITIAWSVTFFFGSAGASAAYLTGSEIFPMETRAMAIAVIYAFGTLAGGISGPLLFGRLIESHDPHALFEGYLIGAALMIVGGLVEAVLGVDAERKPLELIARPLSAVRQRLELAGVRQPRPAPATSDVGTGATR